ncbi:hypothetical protein NMY22_g16398 [Coprinellus aureogranulatus]|nr:hypothetical protein NMY22_g16398 [Coprinellus aureogranulatus]
MKSPRAYLFSLSILNTFLSLLHISIWFVDGVELEYTIDAMGSGMYTPPNGVVYATAGQNGAGGGVGERSPAIALGRMTLASRGEYAEERYGGVAWG